MLPLVDYQTEVTHRQRFQEAKQHSEFYATNYQVLSETIKKVAYFAISRYYAKCYTDARLAAAITPAHSVAHVLSAFQPSHAQCPVLLTRSNVSATCIKTTILCPGLDSALYSVHPYPSSSRWNWKRRLGIGGHALVSWCPEHWTIQP